MKTVPVSFFLRVWNRVIQVLSRDGLYPFHPFGTEPTGNLATYKSLFHDARKQRYSFIDDWETTIGFAVDPEWLDELAFRTQVTVKSSPLNWQHGRILYSTMRSIIDSRISTGHNFTFFETGTARGFSSVCVAKALVDSGAHGRVITIDSLPNDTAMYWNVATDAEGPATRQQLLESWNEELKRIVFLQGWTSRALRRVGLSEIDFAFLDAQHKYADVLREFEWVADRQLPGGVVLFDDVTPGQFDGVVAAVNSIEEAGDYKVERIQASQERGYAIATRM